jgi:hypothetical protein
MVALFGMSRVVDHSDGLVVGVIPSRDLLRGCSSYLMYAKRDEYAMLPLCLPERRSDNLPDLGSVA